MLLSSSSMNIQSKDIQHDRAGCGKSGTGEIIANLNFLSQNEVETSFSFSTIALVVYCFFGAFFLLLACFLFGLGLTPTLPCCRYLNQTNNVCSNNKPANHITHVLLSIQRLPFLIRWTWSVADLLRGKKQEPEGRGAGPDEDYLDVKTNKSSSASEVCAQRQNTDQLA